MDLGTLVIAVGLSVPLFGAVPQETALADIRNARLAGQLTEARELALEALSQREVEPGAAVQLYLELARVEDRAGLHANTRPVALAMAYLDSAEARTPESDSVLAAAVLAMRAELEYRVEMGTDFVRASEYSELALELYRTLGEVHGEADALHRLGLIALQTGDVGRARQLFVTCQRLDEAGGMRPVFQSDVERHVALTDLAEGNVSAAIPHFERSLALRTQSGAIDAAMFAANSLASALIDVGRAREAAVPLLYATTIAGSIDSPVAAARNHLVAGRLHQALGNPVAAYRAYEAAERLATAVELESVARQAYEALEETPPPPPADWK